MENVITELIAAIITALAALITRYFEKRKLEKKVIEKIDNDFYLRDKEYILTQVKKIFKN